MERILAVAVGGALGALARYGLHGAVHRWAGEAFPWGTAAANLLGCFLFGAVWALLNDRAETPPPAVRLALLVGFMGAFTTFSTYIFEAAALLRHQAFLLAGLALAGQVVLGLAGLAGGIHLARAL